MPRGGITTRRAAHPLWGVRPVSATSRHALLNTVPGVFAGVFPGFSDQAPLHLPALSERTHQEVLERLLSRDFDDWSEAVARVGRVPRPLRLQVAPLLDHPRRPAPRPATRPGPHRRVPRHRPPPRPGRPRAADLLADDDTETTLVIGQLAATSAPAGPTKANVSSPSRPPPAPANTTSGSSAEQRGSHSDYERVGQGDG